MKAFEKIAVMYAILITFILHYVNAGCNPGTYGKNEACKICPAHYYCPGNTTEPFQCPPGYTSFDGEAE